MYDAHLDLHAILTERLHIAPLEIQAFCQRWQITELALFGSVLREDFHPNERDGRNETPHLSFLRSHQSQGLWDVIENKIP